MRLSTSDKTGILQAFETILGNVEYDLYLHGSRTNEDAKGGDIDLLVITDSHHNSRITHQKADLLNEIKKRIGDQKVDVTFADEAGLRSDPFLKKIFPTAIRIHSQS